MRPGLLHRPVRQSGWPRRPIAQTPACWTFLPPQQLLTSRHPIGMLRRRPIRRLEGLSRHILTAAPAPAVFRAAAKPHRDEPVAALRGRSALNAHSVRFTDDRLLCTLGAREYCGG